MEQVRRMAPVDILVNKSPEFVSPATYKSCLISAAFELESKAKAASPVPGADLWLGYRFTSIELFLTRTD
jgi:hypothetical protein